jgi:RNA polymerase sigma-70 factor (ECF subfamily)
MSFPGGQRGIAKLVDEHYLALFRYAYRLTGSAADAEDLTQDSFCQAQQKFHQLRDRTKARSWLFSILRNTYLHKLRAGKHEPVISLEWVGDVAELPEDPLPEVDPEQLQKALNELPEVYRTPIILYYFEDFSYRDIADQMELPIGTVMSRLARAKAHLRTRLFPQLSEQGRGENRRANDGLS